MGELQKTVLHAKHLAQGAQMVDFGGWDMPIQYPRGIVEEHLATRRGAGLFDVSHMGRFRVRGKGALAFLQYCLSNDAAGLETGMAQYTMIPNEAGGARDDAYLYRFTGDEYLLVVNAGNKDADWRYLQEMATRFPGTELEDLSAAMAMVSLQGPDSESILAGLVGTAALPKIRKNALSRAQFAGKELLIARTGYTGDPVGCECFLPAAAVFSLWDAFLERGAVPVGLGARDTLRLEAGLPLYGHELGMDPEGKEIPIFACPLARFAVNFASGRESFAGKAALARQFAALSRFKENDYSSLSDLPRVIRPFALTGKGIARAGFKVFAGEEAVGFVTSGTMVPYWKMEGEGPSARVTEERGMRAIGLMLVDARLGKEAEVAIEIRGSRVAAISVDRHLRSNLPPYALPIINSKEER
ncbi:MAG: glycine cleavage system aminomethyltransferase GcvT [Deltaproteobacteria bacterium]|nr:glycine cleavage system aminomethyltransferase GcvT [Deltaproteobacteria bacterium]